MSVRPGQLHSHRPCGGPTTGPGSSPPDIDYPWTYIGGSTELIDEPLADDRLEVLPARLTDKPFHDSDTVNARLDDRGGQPQTGACCAPPA
jgi:hypothetical protein